MGPPCFGLTPLCERCRKRGAHRSPMLSNRDCAKRQVGMGMRQQPRSPIGQRRSKQRGRRQPTDYLTQGDKRDRIRHQWPPHKRPSYETAARQGSGSSSHAPPIPRCAQLSGGPARNRVVFISRRHPKGVVRPSLEKRQAAHEHKARSAKSEFRASPLPPRSSFSS